MADALKVLGQVAPATTADAVLYTVPAVTAATISSVVICNTTASAATFRLALGVTTTAANCLYFDVSIPAYNTFVTTIGMTLEAARTLNIKTGTANALTFTAFGVEVT